MSFCRPLLLPVHAPKVPRKRLATRFLHAFSNATVRISTGRYPVGQPTRFLGGLHTRDHIFHTTSPAAVTYSSIHLSKRAMSTTNTETDTAPSQLGTAEYKAKRAQHPKSVANLPSSVYLDVFASAIESKKIKLAEAVVSDILERYEGNNMVRCQMLEHILTTEISPLKRETVLRMLEHLKESSWHKLDSMLTSGDANIARKMLHDSEISDTDRPFLRLFHPALLEKLKTIRSPAGSNTTTFKVPHLIYASFAAIQKLNAMSFHEHALNIFQVLVNLRYIPLEAMHTVSHPSDNGTLIMSMAIIRSCLHWHYRGLAAALMTDLLINSPVDQIILDLNIDIIHSFLNSHPTPRDVAISGHLIRRIHKYSAAPDSIIRLFYKCAMQAGAKQEAEVMYSYTRQDRVLDHHRYPPPQDASLPWLMDHLTTSASRTHLARTLATETVENNLWVPPLFRASFIAKTASRGYATQARALWERYIVGKDGGIVAGNAALLIRMVSLFWNMHKANLEKANALRARAEPDNQEKIERYQKASDDAALFAERVRIAFTIHHAPLKDAPHWHLTSLARACFIVGKLSEGYRAFRYLLVRRETPDLYDCNVALSAVAQLKSRLAARMIERMTEIGLRPDGVSFSTALHYAVVQGDREVANAMIEQIGKLDRKLSKQALTSIIRSTLVIEEKGSQEDLQRALVNVMHLIRSFPQLNMGSQTQMAKALVNASIRAKDGVMAYNFWKLLLKKGGQWDDWEQQNMRHAIAWLIRQPSSTVNRWRRAMMLYELAQRKKSWREDIPTK